MNKGKYKKEQTHPLLTKTKPRDSYTKTTLNNLQLNQSMKPTKVGGPFSIDNMVSVQSKKIKI